MSRQLPINSDIEERIKLLSNTSTDDVFASTCHGTVQYILGYNDKGYPDLISREDMYIFLKTHCLAVKKPQNYDIVTLWSNFKIKGINSRVIPRFQHSAILVDAASEKIYHQRNTCDVFEFSTINGFIESAFPKMFKRDKQVLARFYRYSV